MASSRLRGAPRARRRSRPLFPPSSACPADFPARRSGGAFRLSPSSATRLFPRLVAGPLAAFADGLLTTSPALGGGVRWEPCSCLWSPPLGASRCSTCGALSRPWSVVYHASGVASHPRLGRASPRLVVRSRRIRLELSSAASPDALPMVRLPVCAPCPAVPVWCPLLRLPPLRQSPFHPAPTARPGAALWSPPATLGLPAPARPCPALWPTPPAPGARSPWPS